MSGGQDDASEQIQTVRINDPVPSRHDVSAAVFAWCVVMGTVTIASVAVCELIWRVTR